MDILFISLFYENNLLDNEKLYNFLNKITAFIFAYSITNPGVNSLRTPVYSEMIKIIEEKEITFENYKFDKNSLIASINNYGFWNQRPLTKSMLMWWAFNNENQQ